MVPFKGLTGLERISRVLEVGFKGPRGVSI
jgi:hypothetical protein